MKFSECSHYLEHLLTMHNFPHNNLTKTYAIDYYLYDTSLNRSKFASVCIICAKDVTVLKPDQELPSKEEIKFHLNAHIGVPQFHCTSCLIWFKSVSEADLHVEEAHFNHDSIISTIDYFGVDQNSMQQWLECVKSISDQLHLSIAKLKLYEKQDILKQTQTDKNLVNFLKLCEPDLYSISAFHGYHSKILRLVGDWTSIGLLIQSSSMKDVKICCQEIKEEFVELIMHPKACHSLASLIINCDKDSWDHLLNIVRNDEIRKQFYGSPNAATFFRKVMTTTCFDERRFQHLSIVFSFFNWIDPYMISCQYAGYYLYSIATRPGPAAVGFCKYASENVSYFFKLFVN